MDTTQPTFFNWSSGKDAALALYHLQQNPRYDVRQLLTSVNTHYKRVSMHGLRQSLLERQTAAIGLPSRLLQLPEQPTMEEYNKIMTKELSVLRDAGYTHSGFGDIFLQDLRTYRERQLQQSGLQAVFPLWKRDTTDLILEFLDLGFQAIIVCVNGQLLDDSFAGRVVDRQLLRDLPASVDPCGERGEFHTFCFDGPIFKHAVRFALGEKIARTYKAPRKDTDGTTQTIKFWFQDLLDIHTANEQGVALFEG